MPSIRPRLRRPSAPMVVALLALFVALGGPARAARVIEGSDIKRGSIGSKQVKDRGLKQRDLSRAAVRTLTATPNGSITASKLGVNSVTTRALAPGSVLSGTVGDNSLTATDLATGRGRGRRGGRERGRAVRDPQQRRGRLRDRRRLDRRRRDHRRRPVGARRRARGRADRVGAADARDRRLLPGRQGHAGRDRRSRATSSSSPRCRRGPTTSSTP